MNPNPNQVAAIRQFVASLPGGWANPDAQIRAAMASTLVANPVTVAPQVPKPFDVDDLMAVVVAANQASLATLATTMPNFLQDIDARNLPNLRRWARLLLKLAKITAADATAMQAVVNATQADPSWSAQVPWDVANLGRPADESDIEVSRP